MEWFEKQIIPASFFKTKSTLCLTKETLGKVLLILDDTGKITASKIKKYIRAYNYPILFCILNNSTDIIAHTRELQAYQWIIEHDGSIHGDHIARSEVQQRITLWTTNLQNMVMYQSINAIWYDSKKSYKKTDNINAVISQKCTEYLPLAISIHSELLNHNKPSPSANSALNTLCRRMVHKQFENTAQFNIKGFPAEVGLYKIFLENTGIYINTGENFYDFHKPSDPKLATLWAETDKYLSNKNAQYTAQDIYTFWNTPPIGMKKGMAPIFLIAYLKTREDKVALYIETIYHLMADDLFVDYLLKSPEKVAIKWCVLDNALNTYLTDINAVLKDFIPHHTADGVLQTARALVQRFDSCNKWTIKTKMLSPKARTLRTMIEKANDPNKLLFDDIYTNFGKNDFKIYFGEILNFYTDRMSEIAKLLAQELNIGIFSPENIKDLHTRAKKVYQQKNDLRVGAFASRLMDIKIDDHGQVWVNSLTNIASLAGNAHTNDWIDLDFARAKQEIAILCNAFKKQEVYTYIANNKNPSRTLFSFVASCDPAPEVYETEFSVLNTDFKTVNTHKQKILKELQKTGDENIMLAVLMKAMEDCYDNLKAKKIQITDGK